jgi:DNA-binding phage protein
MSHQTHLPPDGESVIASVDRYLEEAIRDDRAIEALVATKVLGEIASRRAKEAARVATEGSASWSDVGRALGMTKQAAHEKLRARVRSDMGKARSQIEQAERSGHAKIARRADRGREGLSKAASVSASPKIEIARQRIDEWESDQHTKLDRKIEKARATVLRAEDSVEGKLDPNAR